MEWDSRLCKEQLWCSMWCGFALCGVVKAFLRKAQCQLAMRDTTKATETYRKAMEMDPDCAEAHDGYMKAMRAEATEDPEVLRKRALQDPEVQAIIADPAMQIILQQMQKDPRAVREYLTRTRHTRHPPISFLVAISLSRPISSSLGAKT